MSDAVVLRAFRHAKEKRRQAAALQRLAPHLCDLSANPLGRTLNHAVSARHFSTYARDLLIAAVIAAAVGKIGIPRGVGCMKIST